MTDFGLERKKPRHRPMFPEYIPSNPTLRNLGLLEKGKIYDSKGNILFRSNPDEGGEDVERYLFTKDTCLLTQSFTDAESLDFIVPFIKRGHKVLSDRFGSPTLIRLPGGNKGTRWIVR